MKSKKIFLGGLVPIVLIVGVCFVLHQKPAVSAQYKTPQEQNVFVRFDMEAYDLILQNYWKTTSEADLTNLFQLSLQKAENMTAMPVLATTTRSGAAQMLAVAFANATSTDARQQLAENVLSVALYNLVPAGRSGLLSAAAQTALRQEVANVNPANDLYKDLGLADGATPAEVTAAYQKQKTTLEASTSPTAKAQLAQITYVQKVLTNQSSKTLYDQQKVEPTVFSHIIGKTLYLNFDKISPTTLQEFGQAVDAASTTPLDSMIIDLRGNIGGDLDFPQAFLGLFIGPNQYAFDLYHQGDYNAQRTTTNQFAELSRYKEMAILTDNMTQSTAELLAATFKRMRLAVVVGSKTRGWGTVENTFPLTTVIDPSQTFSLLLVHSLTLRDDEQPIEQNGVLPDVDIGQKNWQNELANYFNSTGMIQAVKQAVSIPPAK